jgi:hypothetical protein
VWHKEAGDNLSQKSAEMIAMGNGQDASQSKHTEMKKLIVWHKEARDNLSQKSAEMIAMGNGQDASQSKHTEMRWNHYLMIMPNFERRLCHQSLILCLRIRTDYH